MLPFVVDTVFALVITVAVLPGGWVVLGILAAIVMGGLTIGAAIHAWHGLPWGTAYDAWSSGQMRKAVELDQDRQDPRCITATALPVQYRPQFAAAAELIHGWNSLAAVAQGWVEPEQADAAHRALWTACVQLRYAEKLHRRLAQARRDGLADTEQYAELVEMERASLATAAQHVQALDRVAQLLGELGDELNRRAAHRRLIGDMETYRARRPRRPMRPPAPNHCSPGSGPSRKSCGLTHSAPPAAKNRNRRRSTQPGGGRGGRASAPPPVDPAAVAVAQEVGRSAAAVELFEPFPRVVVFHAGDAEAGVELAQVASASAGAVRVATVGDAAGVVPHLVGAGGMH